jgi:hypothetical protein
VTVIVPLPLAGSSGEDQQLAQLQLSGAQVLTMQAQIAEARRKSQPLIDELAAIERQMIAVTINGRFDEQKVRHLAAKEARVLEKLIIANAELEQKIYWMMTEQQRRQIDELRAQAVVAGER